MMKDFEVTFICGRFGSTRKITLLAFDEEHAKTVIKRYSNVKEFISVKEK